MYKVLCILYSKRLHKLWELISPFQSDFLQERKLFFATKFPIKIKIFRVSEFSCISN